MPSDKSAARKRALLKIAMLQPEKRQALLEALAKKRGIVLPVLKHPKTTDKKD